MKFGVFWFSFICCFCVIYSGVIDNSSCEPRTKRQITDMTPEVLLIIFNKLQLYDLLQVAQTNKYLSNWAGDVFRHRYSSRIFEISGSTHVFPSDTLSLIETHSHIYIEGAKMSTIILRVFGYLIQQLSINFFYLSPSDRNAIEQIIENQCAVTLKRLDIHGFEEDILSGFTKPLNGVEMVKIQGKFPSSNGNTLKLNELLPRLRVLCISYTDSLHPTMFDLQFPHLEHFDINLMHTFVQQSPLQFMRNMRFAIRNLLKKNPTIKSLIFNNCHSLTFLKMASDYLPNLEEIIVDFVGLDQYKGEHMHFASVKSVDFLWTDYNMSTLMSFDKLDNLKLSCSAHDCIEFVKENKNVKQLDMFGRSLSHQDILSIAEILPNLVELTLTSDVQIQANSFIELIQRCKYLEKVTTEFTGGELFNILSQQMSEDWEIKKVNYEIVLEKVSKVENL